MTNGSAPPLPEFKNPPVVELALSIKFKTLKLTTSHVGLLWQRFRSDFPVIEDQPPLDLPIEIERERVPPQSAGQLRVLSLPQIRSWFVSASGTQLIQVQHDLFAHNWRKNDTDETYPRFENVRRSFEHELGILREFLAEHGLGEPDAIQCEVTYINHIAPGAAWKRHDELQSVFRFWVRPDYQFLPALDDGRFLLRFVIPDDDGRFCGRLHISSQPAFIETRGVEQPIFATVLTARGRPLGKGLAGALQFLDTGHEWIVRGFADITTEKAHQQWGRTR